MPNSLTWGPDGWLYGLNGVFNPAHVTYGPKNPNFKEGQTPWHFTCAMFRIHPKTREFQVFCEGTSNPWGIAFNDEGDAFISACVIDHLWHLTETGYYHRQGGPYPPFTWKIESIVGHKHQKAAYCGIHWYDSDAYPEQYRRKLYMGNIHGSCINADRIERRESTYQASPEEDLLSANDAWFMPVVQKTGPDGCLYVLDWYDRYHCYQDANRDPAGIDRLKGRLYRLRYKDTPHAKPFNLASDNTTQLIEMLASRNGYQRDMAQRLLSERLSFKASETTDLRGQLEAVVLSSALREQKLIALGVLLISEGLDEPFHRRLLASDDVSLKSWAVRAVGEQSSISGDVASLVQSLTDDPSPQVRLQVAIAATKQAVIPKIPTLVAVLAQAGKDPLVPRIVWQNLHPLLEAQTAEFVAEIDRLDSPKPTAVLDLLPRAADRILSTAKPDTGAIAHMVTLLLKSEITDDAADRCLQLLTTRIRSGEITGDAVLDIRTQLNASLLSAMKQDTSRPSTLSAVELAASLKVDDAIRTAHEIFSQTHDEGVQLRIVNALVTAGEGSAMSLAASILTSSNSTDVRRKAIQTVGRVGTKAASEFLLQQLPQLPADVQPSVVEALTDREDSAIILLSLVRDAKIPASLINANQANKMLSLKSQALAELVARHWGVVRTERDPARIELISRMRNELRTSEGDPVAGRVVFKRVCDKSQDVRRRG
ncbi:MAG: PVC-type heme-binding CxxCH protein [Planctomycetaceae bacterium]